MTKPRLFWMLTLTVFFALSQLSFSQISSGGTPPSFSMPLASVVPSTQMPPVDAQAYLTEDEQAPKDSPLRFAADLDVNLDLTNSGSWTELRGGDRVWRLRIVSRGALSIGLLYDLWYLPKGGELYIYNDDHSQVIGAFTSFNNWVDNTNITQPVKGEAITLEYFEPAAIKGQTILSIRRVCHAYRDLYHVGILDAFNSSGACNNNVNCPEGAGWQSEKRGVAMILSGGSRICTGSLINNTSQNFVPYFLTANHCLGGETSWVFMFNYESASCSNVDGPTNQTVANATLRATSAASDFALLQLSSNVPTTYNPYFNGWNRVDAAATSSVCIHHPSGDIKKISFDNNAPQSSGYFGAGSNHWNILAWDDGTTEPGSSGSPLFDQNHRITGQLHGGDATCSNNVNDFFGKLAVSWAGGGTSATRLSNWLDPLGTAPTTLNGINGGSGGGGGPANDTCPGTAITALPYSTTGTTATAVNNYTNCVGATSKDVVYNMTLSSCQNVTVSTCGSSYDTGLGVRSGGACPGTTQVACNDDYSGCGTGSQVSFQASAGTTYYIIVHGYSTNSGSFSLNVTGTACVANNDVCPGTAITALPYSTTGSTATAANNYTNCVGSTSRDRVYNMTLTACRVVTVSTCGSSYDTGLGVRTGGACPGTTQVACNDDYSGCGTGSQVTFTATANTTYYFIVHGYSTNSGNYTLNVTGGASCISDHGDEPVALDDTPSKPTEEVVTEYALLQNYPNPFNPFTKIEFDLPESGFTTIRVFNIAGQEVKSLIGEYMEAGKHFTTFDGLGFSSGVYVYQLQSGKFSDTKKMVLMK